MTRSKNEILIKTILIVFPFVPFTGEEEFNFIIAIRQLLFHLIEQRQQYSNKKKHRTDAF